MDRPASHQRQKQKQQRKRATQEDFQACPFPFTHDYGMAPIRTPSSAGLPNKWSAEMDRFICFSDAVGETPTRMVIISLKKRFPELNQVLPCHAAVEHTPTQADSDHPQFSISDLAIERRIYCLDRMENNYFKKGSHMAVQRLESMGITLPPPDHGLDQDVIGIRDSGNMSPVGSTIFEAPSITQAGAIRLVGNTNNESPSLTSARYTNERYLHKDDPFTITRGRTSPETSAATPRASANSSSTIRMPSHENVTTRSLAPVAKASSSNLRPGKDLAPVASLSQLRVSEDGSSHGSHISKSKPSMESYIPRRQNSTPSNDPSAFSYGSPRTPLGRVRPTPLSLKTGSGHRAKDENTPLTLSHLGDDGNSTLSSTRYF
ncbi:MAG: hypothetical protein Q9169_007726 [Polycauliona sp. 2 TL-2023]